jgi:hypothetical protein
MSGAFDFDAGGDRPVGAPLPGIGHNSRSGTPYYSEALRGVETLWTEAVHWLDGAVAESQAEADAIATLLDMARKARATADGARKAEAKPFDDGKA